MDLQFVTPSQRLILQIWAQKFSAWSRTTTMISLWNTTSQENNRENFLLLLYSDVSFENTTLVYFVKNQSITTRILCMTYIEKHRDYKNQQKTYSRSMNTWIKNLIRHIEETLWNMDFPSENAFYSPQLCTLIPNARITHMCSIEREKTAT